ncbi:MAG: sensor histidine kinase [Parcubacteria group bacterium]|nr:sensor histidine kinase [Parcubacteria group bacterium]
MLNDNVVILIVSTVTNLLLGLFVWRAQRRTIEADLFLCMVGLIILWTIANYATDVSSSAAGALFWTRALFIFATAFIYAFYLFTQVFPRKTLPRITPYSLAITIIAITAIVLTAGTNLIFSDATIGTDGLDGLGFGALYLPINLFGLVMVGSGISALAQTARRAGRTLIRDQAVIIIIGWVSFLGLVIIFAAVLPYFFPALVNTSKIAPLFSITMVACSAYAIVRHQFLDVTPLLRRGLVYSLLLGTLLSLYIALLGIIAILLRTDSDTLEFLAGVATVIAGIFGSPHIEAYFRKETDRFFFKDTYEYSATIEELCHMLNTTVRIPQLIAHTIYTLTKVLKSERIEFLYLKTGNRYDHTGRIALPFEPLLPQEDGLIIAICSENGPIGELLLWAKRSGDPYTKEDKALLRTFASQASIALEKAELYEQLKEHSETLEGKVQDRTQHLESLRASQREFMDDISHALQTPLTVLTSAMEVVGKDLPPEQNHHIRLAERSVGELSRLVQNLLVLARIDAMPDERAGTSFDLASLTERLIEYVGVICANKGIILTSAIEPGLSVIGNKMQIEEALTNILANSVRYTAGCLHPSIHVELARSTSGFVCLSVKDTGVGISEEKLPHIFERFYRAQDTQGSGIGLAITKRIVERHNGRIEVASAPGNGTTMIVYLPSGN